MNFNLPFKILKTRINARGIGRVEQWKIEVWLDKPAGQSDAMLYRHRDGTWMLSFSCGLQKASEGDLLCLIALSATAEEIARPQYSHDFQI